MKTTIKKRPLMFGLIAAGCAMGMALPSISKAEVSDADFKALQESVRKLSDQVQQLQQTHATDAQTHQKDVEQLHQLQEKLGETQKSVATVEQTAAAVAAAQAQPVLRTPLDEATVNHNFQILGDAEFQFAKTQGQHSSFLFADFAPIFLYRGGDRILFEAGFDFGIQNNAPNGGDYTTTINLSFAQLDYIMTDYATFVAGNMVLPLGTYSERTAGWLNKFPDDPFARDLLPGSGVGVQIRGAVPLGEGGKLFNYSVFGVNGPGSINGTGNADQLDLGGNVGLRSDNMVANLHGNPSGGGRIAVFLPYKPHYDFELGLSGQSGEWDNAGRHLWSAGVIDASLHLGPNIEAKGEYALTRYGTDDVGLVHQQGWWAQVGYKLAGLNLDLPVINNLELMGRYDSLHDGLGTRSHRYSVGYIYYITNTLLFEGDYEFLHSSDPTQPHNQFILQLSYGF
jgi:hypothetical protein